VWAVGVTFFIKSLADEIATPEFLLKSCQVLT
jgi:hypothetical protein